MNIQDKNRQLALRQQPTLLGVPLNRAERRQIQRGEVFNWETRCDHNLETNDAFFLWSSNLHFDRCYLQHQIDATLGDSDITH